MLLGMPINKHVRNRRQYASKRRFHRAVRRASRLHIAEQMAPPTDYDLFWQEIAAQEREEAELYANDRWFWDDEREQEDMLRERDEQEYEDSIRDAENEEAARQFHDFMEDWRNESIEEEIEWFYDHEPLDAA